MQIRDRIKELRRVRAADLRPNPKNWKHHPDRQRDALRGLLAEIGIAGAALARELEDGSLELIDGHLRAETTPDNEVPVLVLDVTAEEADKILATFDPLGDMAETDDEALSALLAGIDTSSEALQELLDDLGSDEPDVSDEDDHEDANLDDDPPESRYTEQYGVIVICSDEAHQQQVFADLSGQGYNCKVVVT